MGRRENILERFARSTDLNTEPLPQLPLVEIAGQQRVLMENHQGVIKYSGNEIRVKVCYGYVCICGRGLKLLQMSKVRLVITGCIDSVQLVRGR